MTYMDDIMEKNKKYEEELRALRVQLLSDFESKGKDSPVVKQLLEDDDLSLTTLFYIMFTSCGGVKVEDGTVELIRLGTCAYDEWDGTHLCLASAEHLYAGFALDLIDMPNEDCFILCAPGVISDADLFMFNTCFDVVYSEHDATAVFSHGLLGTYPTRPIPDWARYILAQHAIDLLTLDVVNDHRIICFNDRYPVGMTDEIVRSNTGIVKGLMCGEDIPREFLYRPATMDKVEPWRPKALTSKFVLSPDADSDMKKLYDIYRLWNDTCASLSIATVMKARDIQDEAIVEERLGKLADVLGMRSSIDAYLSGVPIEDLVA